MADIDLVDQESFDDHGDRHEDGGADELNVDGLPGVLADQQDPQSHGNARHTENFIPDTEIGEPDGVAALTSDGVLPNGQVPSLAITDVSTVDEEDDLTTLTDAELGDVGIVLAADGEDNNTFILTGEDPTVQDDWVEIQSPKSPVQSVNDQTGDVVLDSDDVGAPSQNEFDSHGGRHEDGGADELNVDGLSGVLADQQDPQSHGNDRHTENFIPDTEIGEADGVASLDGSAQVPDNQSQVASVNGQKGDVDLDSDDVGAPSQSEFDNHSARHENGGADELNVDGLSGVLADQQDPQSHGNERHTENFTEDTHDHSGGSDGSDTLNPDTVNADEVNADDQLDAPRVDTRDDFDGVGLFYIEDEDQVAFRVS